MITTLILAFAWKQNSVNHAPIPGDPALLPIARQLQDLIEDKEHHAKTLRLIRAGNLLIPLGRDKAIAVLDSVSRNSQIFPADLAMILPIVFPQSGQQPTYEVPALGFTMGSGKMLKPWMDYPILMIDDIPFSLPSNMAFAGEMLPLHLWLAENGQKLHIRTSLLQPPSDPFPSYLKAIKDPRWPFRGERLGFAPGGGDLSRAAILLQETLTVAEGAISRQEWSSLGNGPLTGNYDRYHDAFVQAGGHWDAKVQSYALRDGTQLKATSRIGE